MNRYLSARYPCRCPSQVWEFLYTLDSPPQDIANAARMEAVRICGFVSNDELPPRNCDGAMCNRADEPLAFGQRQFGKFPYV